MIDPLRLCRKEEDSTSVVPAARHFERVPRLEPRRARTTARMEPGLEARAGAGVSVRLYGRTGRVVGLTRARR